MKKLMKIRELNKNLEECKFDVNNAYQADFNNFNEYNDILGINDYGKRKIKYEIYNQSVDRGVYRTRSLMDRTPLWLRGRCGSENCSEIPPRLHLSSVKNSENQINVNKESIDEKIKEKQTSSLDKTHIWLRGNLHYENNNNNNYLKLSVVLVGGVDVNGPYILLTSIFNYFSNYLFLITFNSYNKNYNETNGVEDNVDSGVNKDEVDVLDSNYLDFNHNKDNLVKINDFDVNTKSNNEEEIINENGDKISSKIIDEIVGGEDCEIGCEIHEINIKFIELMLLYQRTFIIERLCLWYQGKDKNLAQFILSFTIIMKGGKR